jgi:hypothetical protein
VEAVDDLRTTNPPSNQALFQAACDYLVVHNYDLQELMRAILRSAAYQRSSETVAGNEPDQRFYSHYYPRRLAAEVMLDAMSQATEAPTEFAGYPKGTRALQLPDSDVVSYFLSTFGRPERLITCECERTDEPSMSQVLHLYNGDTLLNKLQSVEGRIARQLAAGAMDEEIIDTAYLSCLSRRPTAEEKTQLLQVFSETPPEERRQVVEDLYWSVLSTKEFLFNH